MNNFKIFWSESKENFARNLFEVSRCFIRKISASYYVSLGSIYCSDTIDIPSMLFALDEGDSIWWYRLYRCFGIRAWMADSWHFWIFAWVLVTLVHITKRNLIILFIFIRFCGHKYHEWRHHTSFSVNKIFPLLAMEALDWTVWPIFRVQH